MPQKRRRVGTVGLVKLPPWDDRASMRAALGRVMNPWTHLDSAEEKHTFQSLARSPEGGLFLVP